MTVWRASRAILTLKAEVDAAHPNRDRISDGIKGDDAHAARKSDHNPDADGIVHAWDCTKDLSVGLAQSLVDFLEAKRDPRTKYVIWQGHILKTYPSKGKPAWSWHPYTGPNAHNHHAHISVYGDDGAPWGYPTATPEPEPPKGWLDMLSDAEQTELLAKTREIHRQVTVSADRNAKGGATLRWLSARLGRKV